MKTLSILLAVGLGVLFLAVAPSVAGAVSSARPTTANSAAANGQANREARLTEAKLKVCQNREKAIQQRSNQLAKMAKNMLTTFEKIANRVEQYYTSKVVPSGKTVSNYDALMAEIASKKEVVQTALNKVTTGAEAFSCTSDDPKGQLTQFRTDMQAVKQGLKDYRTAIKNLIVAIRSLQGQAASSPNSSPSPSPTISPSKEAE